jgi:hypothetical protein
MAIRVLPDVPHNPRVRALRETQNYRPVALVEFMRWLGG